MATPIQPQPQAPQIQPDQVLELARFQILTRIVNILSDETLSLDVMTKAVDTLAGAYRTLSERQIPVQAQFELEALKAQHEMNLKNAQFEHQRQMDIIRLQHELRLKEQELQSAVQKVEDQRRLKVIETAAKLETERAKQETIQARAQMRQQAGPKPNPGGNNPSNSPS